MQIKNTILLLTKNVKYNRKIDKRQTTCAGYTVIVPIEY